MLSKAQEGVAEAGKAATTIAAAVTKLQQAVTAGSLPEINEAVLDLQKLAHGLTSMIPMLTTEGKETADSVQALAQEAQQTLNLVGQALTSTLQQIREVTRSTIHWELEGEYNREKGTWKNTSRFWRDPPK